MANPRLNDIDFARTLASIKFLEDVPKRALKAAGKEAQWFSVPAGAALFEAGETSKSIYFVLTGSFGAFRGMGDGRTEFLGHIRAGEPVGEMALFQGDIDEDEDGEPDNAPHSSSVYALRDSEVLEISRAGFSRLIHAEPEILSAMIRLILSRTRDIKQNRRSRRTAPKVFALVATSPSVELERRAIRLKRALDLIGVTCRVVDETEGDDKSSKFFDRLEAENDVIIFTSTIGDNSWYRLSTRQADRIWIMAQAGAKPSYPILPEDTSPAFSLKLVDVVLIHSGSERRACDPQDWSEATGAARIFHWHDSARGHCERLARTMAGRSVGLVFSGGGARAYAHIGVVKALREAGIPIDFAGGSSMGAVIAGCVAMGWSDAEIDLRIRQAFVDSNPLGDWTIPVVGMVKGRRVDNRLKEHFGEAEIGDLEIPYFAVSTNLTDGAYRVHREGLLRRALRATISLPGILPPVIDDGEVLVDGGVLNNFPTNVMREFQRGFMVGCDVARAPRGLRADDFINPPGFFGWVTRHGFSSPPPIAGLLMRSGTISVNPIEGRELVDILVLPELKDVELRDWEVYEETVEAGYLAARNALASSNLLSEINGD